MADGPQFRRPRGGNTSAGRPAAPGSAHGGCRCQRLCPRWEITSRSLCLMIPLDVEMLYVFCQRSPQRCLPKQHQLGEAFLFHRADPTLREGVQIRTARRQSQRLDSAGRQDVSERLTELRIPIVQQITARFQKSQPSSVALRAICCIQPDSG
jgi:hypothetical protein